MNKTSHEAGEYVVQFRKLLRGIDGIDVADVFLIPPFTAIDRVRKESMGKFWVGAQNMHWAEQGPYTGEISAPMLLELGVDLVQLGHAERRQFFNETDQSINRNHCALHFGLRPLVCVSEDSEDRKSRAQRETVARQLRIALNGVPKNALRQLIVAYEPFWAIGDSGITAEPEYVRQMTQFCRAVLADMYGSEAERQVAIIYGGSVNSSTAPHFLLEGQSDGVFVGRAALDPETFAEVISACLKRLGLSSVGPQLTW